MRRKADKKTTPKDSSSDARSYGLNMSHLMKRSENYREYKQQQAENAQTIQLQLQVFQSQKAVHNKGGAIVSSFQGLMKNNKMAPGIVGSKRGGLNLFTKGREIDELRNRERYYWMMRKHGKGITQATNNKSFPSYIDIRQRS